MKLDQLLAELASRRVRVSVEGDQLKVKAAKGAVTPELRDALKEWKRTLVERLSSGQAQVIELATPIAATPRTTDDHPLSFAQQRLWFLDRLDPGRPTYNLPEAYRLRAAIDVEALIESIRIVVRRHEALRTRFEYRDWQPVQVISETDDFDVPVVGVAGETIEDRERELQIILDQEARTAFDLTVGPLIRVCLFRLAADDHVLFCNVHHIVFDSWSNGVFLREIDQAYQAVAANQPSQLPDLPIQYADYAYWEKTWLTEENARGLLDGWRSMLEGGETALELPADHPRPPAQTYHGSRFRYWLRPELSERVRSAARLNGTTVYIALLAAFQMLLSRWSGQVDLCVGCPISGRERPEVRGMVGFFVNTMVLRGDLSGDPTFAEMCMRAREVTSSAYALSKLPFERLVEELQPERDPSRSPLFQVMLSLAEANEFEFLGRPLERIPLDAGTSKFDLTLELYDGGGSQIGGYIEYATDLFERTTIERLGEHYQVLLEQVLANPQRRLSELDTVPGAERERLLGVLEQTRQDYPRQRPVHALFSRQAAATPQAEAVRFENDALSYEQLEQGANRLARHLQEVGLEPGRLVGICLERSVDMVVGLLAVLKAGAAYVPLDPAFPRERLGFMVEDSGLEFLLTHSGLQQAVPGEGLTVICVDHDREAIAAREGSGLAEVGGGEDLAYVIYTSGSTGLPKGVRLPHRALTNFLCTMAKEPGLEAGETLLAVTTLSFDIAGLELYLPLVTGARVVIASHEVATDGRRLGQAIVEHGVSTMQATPATWRLLLEAGWEAPAGLKVLCGGELFPREVAERLLGQGAEVWNLYGPTETTIWSAVHRVQSGEGLVPIGKGVGNTSLYVLDENRGLVPFGVIGELYIGGDGLALGYLGRPELDAERFVAHPFVPGERLYRTGDLARYRADGTLEVHGRIDDQVKLRGFRIELGEVETNLARHRSVDTAVCMVREDTAGDERLVAYVVVSAGQALDVAELRAHLREMLPEYMVPSVYEPLEAVPLTPNGKVDRKALPAPEGTAVAARAEYVAPRTPLERTLCEIWSRVLGVESVGIRDDFFDLGGHSLLVVRLLFELEAELERALELPVLFRVRTVEQQAAALATPQTVAVESPAITRVPRDETTRLELSFGQQRLWFLEQLDPGLATYNLPVAYRLRGPLDLDALEQSLRAVLRRHEALRTHFRYDDWQPWQVVENDEVVRLTVVELDGETLAEREHVLQLRLDEEVRRPFDLRTGPLFRAQVLRLDAHDHVLLYNVHHIVFDNGSIALLLDELDALYEALRAGREPTLPELEVQYADYARWQNRWLDEANREHLLGYWREQLAGAGTALELPTDHPRPPAQSYRGARFSYQLPPEVTEALRTFARTSGSTSYMVLLAAFQMLLSRWTGQTDLCIGSPISGRTRPELERLIGFFVNNLVLRGDLSGDPTFAELCLRTQQTALEAYAYADVPFQLLVEELQPERDPSRPPLFQAMFVYATQDAPAFGECAAEYIELNTGTSKFDLTLELYDGGGSQIGGYIEYATDLFERTTIERLGEHYQVLLEQVLANPQRRLSELDTVPGAERERLLGVLEQTRQDYPRQRPVHALFSRQAAATPQAEAVRFENDALSYEQLEQGANRLARHLQEAGLEPGRLVGICLERSVDMVVGLLAVLKAGAAYVPLDPAFPRERLGFMVEDSGLEFLLTHSGLQQAVPGEGLTVICVDDDREAIAACEGSGLAEVGGGEDLAYVIYTSGSTGLPKGVRLPHRALTNFLCTMAKEPGLEAGETLLAVTTLSFDIAGLELYLPLVTGARVVIASHEVATDGRRLGQAIVEHGVSTMQATPATWRLLLEAGWEAPAGLKVLCGGELFPREVAERLLGQGAEVWNLYGPTETTIWSAVHRVQSGEGLVPIGKGVGNTSLYVLDENRGLVPFGVIGELYIGGDGLALGYLGRPELDAERFVAHPFVPGERLYRTGDLARYRADGTLEVHGRIDDQVKLRGFRIELGEVETNLARHRSVDTAVCMVREDTAGDERLVAYVVVSAGQALDVAELRAHLREMLPEYMVPSVYEPLEAVPLTPNGKVDRKALPAPEGTAVAARAEYVAPRTPLERTLCEIWSRVLGVESVGIHDDFFDLGGHSLLVVRLASEVETELDLDVSLAAIFHARTIEALSQLLSDSETSSQATAVVPMRATGSKPALFVGGSHPRYAAMTRELGAEQPVYRLDVYSLMNLKDNLDEPMPKTIEEMASYFLPEIKALQPHGPYQISGGCEGAMVAFEIALMLQRAGEPVANLAVWAVAAPGAQGLTSWRESTAMRLYYQLRSVLSQGTGALLSPSKWRRILKHELVEYRIFRAMCKYRPRGRYHGDLFLARTLANDSRYDANLPMGWDDLVTGKVEVQVMRGTHQSWLQEDLRGFTDALGLHLSTRST